MKVGRNTISLLKTSVYIFIKAILGLSILTSVFGAFYWYDNRLFLWEASLIWPQEPFSESKFKIGSTQDRSRMVVDLIRNEKLLGVASNKIQEQLGGETGDYYYNDSNFTYRLTERGSADWILTLIPGDNGKIRQIFIRKSCCSISQKILYWSLENSESLIRKILQ
ncbi:MAG TPA: hypothetical protein VIG33_05270 [Pseudobdellovibrionaceae bacterium]|jgi:hypothetical protein